ncbi:hypothetical protein LWI28_026650 [Acer negundo]|uniref:Uncharacterized protein n=1 Tax=Acer negundo TaxID=4023 RepID=A0AAD5NYI9_ACENE|nr:hypothetical protein LWI28_026650 [Acer negundo]
MASCRSSDSSYSDPTHQSPSNSGDGGGVRMMSTKWRDKHLSFINFISSFLTANSFCLNFVLIAPDLIFNCGGLQFVCFCNELGFQWQRHNLQQKLKEQFAHLYVVVTLPTRELNESFVRS